MNSFKEWLEIIYFITGGPALAVIGYFALEQIKISKETSQTNALRDSYKISAMQTEFFVKELIPKIICLRKRIKENDIGLLRKSKINLKENGVSVERYIQEGDKEKIMLIAEEIQDVINLVETFSLYFTSKVGSEKIAFSSVGHTYVDAMSELMPIILMARDGKHYDNLMKLYFLWAKRIESTNLIKEKAKIEEKLKSRKSEEFFPIGTN